MCEGDGGAVEELRCQPALLITTVADGSAWKRTNNIKKQRTWKSISSQLLPTHEERRKHCEEILFYSIKIMHLCSYTIRDFALRYKFAKRGKKCKCNHVRTFDCSTMITYFLAYFRDFGFITCLSMYVF